MNGTMPSFLTGGEENRDWDEHLIEGAHETTNQGRKPPGDINYLK